MGKVWKWIYDHSLLLSFVALFLIFLTGQVVAGVAQYNHTQAQHGLGAVTWQQYMCTGNFLEGVFANWQAAILQLGALIVFAIFLKTRGAAHSLRPGSRPKRQKSGKRPESRMQRNWFYRNSLSIAFGVLFVLCFVLHLLSATWKNNEQLALLHQPSVSISNFAVSAKFWFETMQTWEAEFMAIGLYVFLSIFLRQEGSPESKPVDAPDEDTGDTNK